MSKELIERLRGNPFKVLGGDYIEAADTIESLTAERDRLLAELAELRAQEPVAYLYTMPVSGERIASVERKLMPNERPLYADPVPAQVPVFWYVPADSDDDEDALVLPTRDGSCPSSYTHSKARPLYAAPVPAAVPVVRCVGRARFPRNGGNAGLSWYVEDIGGCVPKDGEPLFVIAAAQKKEEGQ